MVELQPAIGLASGPAPRAASTLPPLHPWLRALILPGADFSTILALPLLASLLRQSTEHLALNLAFWPLLALLAVLLTASHGGYRGSRPAGTAINCFLGTSLAMLALAVLLGHPHIITRDWTVLDLAATPALLAWTRHALSRRLPAAARPGGALAVCHDHCPRGLTEALAERQVSSRIEGILYLSAFHEASSWNGWRELENFELLLDIVRQGTIQDIIFVNHPELDNFAGRHGELLQDLLTYPIRIWTCFDMTPHIPGLLRGRSGGCRLLPIVSKELVTSRNIAKRCFDIAASAALLVLSAPLLLLIAGLVRADSKGPVIFRQSRIGAHGRPFTLLKFRTMAHGLESPFRQARRDDPRTTKIGRFLRAMSLDELPQLINVLRGDMSLVGPRPHAAETEVEGISFENALRLYRVRHRVKPGMTGLAQIRGQRGETRVITALEHRLASDLEYIQSWSIWLDVSILFRTIPAILSRKNAW